MEQFDNHGKKYKEKRPLQWVTFSLAWAFVIHTQLTFEAVLSPVRVGKVLVHCARGVSRSATLALAFLMIKERLTLVEAVEAVRRHRNILPNVGFLNQLCHLDSSLALKRKTTYHHAEEEQSTGREFSSNEEFWMLRTTPVVLHVLICLMQMTYSLHYGEPLCFRFFDVFFCLPGSHWLPIIYIQYEKWVV